MSENTSSAAEQIQIKFSNVIDRTSYLMSLCNVINSSYPDSKISECIPIRDIGCQFNEHLDVLAAMIETAIYKLEGFVGHIQYEPTPPQAAATRR